MSVCTITIDDQLVSIQEDSSVLDAAKAAGITIPTLCHMDGVYDTGACRMCLVEVEGIPKLLPACTTTVSEGWVIHTNSERLQKYRRMTLELLFAERNHVCAACVANGHCELQTMAYSQGMDHVRYDYCYPKWGMDLTHPLFGMDHNRCILCARCVRTCWHIEGAGTKNLAGRGGGAHIITDMNEDWGDSTTCTRCGKCVQSCPTGALFQIGATAGEMTRNPARLNDIITARRKKEWNV